MIPYFRLAKPQTELDALKEVYSSGQWANGNAITDVQEKLKVLFNKPYVVLTSNGYSALFLAIKSLGIKNEKIILPAIGTCFAISNAIIATGNTPIFCDVNVEDGNCSKENVKHLVETQSIKHIITPNYAGNLSSVKYFKDVLKMIVIEDACQSFFSSAFAKNSIADVQVFSFYPTKGINGIDGGAIVTNDKDVYTHASSLVYYNEQEYFETTEHYNFRFLNINASVLNSNLDRRDDIAKKLNGIEVSYTNSLKESKVIKYLKNNESKTAHRFVLKFENDSIKKNTINFFEKKNISITPFYIWNCKQDESSEFKNALNLVSNCFCIPFFEDLQEDEIALITNTLKDVIAKS